MDKTNTYRGKRNPPRDRCENCGKKGLGPPKPFPNGQVLKNCRYCLHVQEVTG